MFKSYQAIAITLCLLIGNAVHGQAVVTVPEDAKFVVQVNVGAFRDTLLGDKLLDLTKKMAAAELDSDADEMMEKVEEALGFNPLEEIQSLTIIGRSFEDAEENLHVILRLAKTTGNLEGMMLALPNYSSAKQGEHVIHSAGDGGKSAYCAIHTGQDGNKTILAATNRSDVIEMLETFDATAVLAKPVKTTSWIVPAGTFAQVQILQFPDEVLKHEQAANISKLLENIAITVREQGEDISANLILNASDEKRAEQIQQLVQGVKALVGLFKDEIGDDEDAQLALSIAEKITVNRDGTSVVVQASVPQSMIIKFLREEADLPL